MQKSLGHAHGWWRMGLSDLPFFCSSPDDCVSRTTMTLVSRTYPGLNRQGSPIVVSHWLCRLGIRLFLSSVSPVKDRILHSAAYTRAHQEPSRYGRSLLDETRHARMICLGTEAVPLRMLCYQSFNETIATI